jgi:hypothetical protein
VLDLATLNRRPLSTAEERRIGRRRLVLASLALLPVLALAGCRSGRATGDVAVLEPVPDSTPVPPPDLPVPSITPSPPAVSTTLELADQAFATGDYEAALDAYRSHLDGDAAGAETDRVLYRLAVLHLANGGPARDSTTGYALLRRLVREHPESPYRMEAEVILALSSRVDGLETEIDRLESQLEALKRIDLERYPNRPNP